MYKVLMSEYVSHLAELNGKDLLYATIMLAAAPTLKKYKPSFLMSFTSGRKDYQNLWIQHGKSVCLSLGLFCLELVTTDYRTLVLFYNRKLLQSHLDNQKSVTFLKSIGYDDTYPLEECLTHLKKRFKSTVCPHEIGIFLGFPVEDVIAFIENNGENFIFSGYWKVYNNPEKARSLFQLYDHAKTAILRKIISRPKTVYAYAV